MDNFNLINKVDAVCDCIPLVSTLTNTALLLLKLAMKVNLVANPVSPGLKDDIKMYAIYKSKAEYFWGMIPLFGNIVSLLDLLFGRFDTQNDLIIRAIIRKDVEKVKVHLARYPNEPESKMERYLSKAVYSSSPEIVSLLLKSREWSQASLALSLTRFPDTDHAEENNNLILDYLDRFDQIPLESEYKFQDSFIEFAKKGCLKTAQRFLKYLSERALKTVLKHIFLNTAYCRNERVGVTLYLDQIHDIINKLGSIDIGLFQSYLTRTSLDYDLLIFDLNLYKKNDDKPLVEAFFEDHSQLTYRLLNKLTPIISNENVCWLIAYAINTGVTPLVTILMDKFEDRLSHEDRIKALENCFLTTLQRPKVAITFKHFYTTYCLDISKERLDELKNFYQNSLGKAQFVSMIESVQPQKIS